LARIRARFSTVYRSRKEAETGMKTVKVCSSN
jgi:hypothetical protein